MADEAVRRVYGWVVELYRLGRLGKLVGSQVARVRSLMGLLRGAGFGSGEISYLSGGRWGASYVRRYAVWDGVVDVSRKNQVLEVFAEFVTKGGNIDDIPGYLDASAVLNPIGLTFMDAAMIGVATRVSGMDPQGMASFAADLVDGKAKIVDLTARMKLDAKLNGLGLTRGVQMRIMKVAKGYPSIDRFFEVLGEAEILDKLLDLEVLAESRIKKLEGNIANLEERKGDAEEAVRKVEAPLNDLYMLIGFGWNIVWLAMLLQVMKKYGDPGKVLADFNQYGSMKELIAELEETRRKLREAEALAGAKAPQPSELVPQKFRIVEEIPLMRWGRREIEAVLVGALKGLNEYAQRSQELAEDTKVIINEGVNQLLSELKLLGIG